ncbi:MAG: hypothetical protein GY938_16925 [Ketobacter sp.]|nr:hypothetical protein [Ketobacter sp.]
MTAKERQEFRDKMKSQGWEPINDTFGNTYQWKHKQTKKKCQNIDAEKHYTMAGYSPAPF